MVVEWEMDNLSLTAPTRIVCSLVADGEVLLLDGKESLMPVVSEGGGEGMACSSRESITRWTTVSVRELLSLPNSQLARGIGKHWPDSISVVEGNVDVLRG